MNPHLPLLIAILVIIAGYSTLTNLNAAVVVSNGLECDDTMLLVSNPTETAFGDSIFVSSSVQQRTPSYSSRLWDRIQSQQWITQGTDSCSGDLLTEWSCTSSRAGAKAISGKVTCKYGCRNGHCLLPTCYDPDIAHPYTRAASTTGIMLSDPQFLGVPPPSQEPQEYADYCTTDIVLTEYSCQQLGGGSYVKPIQKSCRNLGTQFKCLNGRCVSSELS